MARRRSASSSASVYARDVARRRHGTPRVIRYCLSAGRYSRPLVVSPFSLQSAAIQITHVREHLRVGWVTD